MSRPLTPGTDQRTPTSVRRFISRMTRSSTPVCQRLGASQGGEEQPARVGMGQERQGMWGCVEQMAGRLGCPDGSGDLDEIAVGGASGL